MNWVALFSAGFLLSALVLCAFSGVRVWVVSEGLVSSHCIRSVALVTMATCVEIKRGIVSDSSGKCVLMWVWGNSIAWIVGFWVGEMPQSLNNNEKKKSLSQEFRSGCSVFVHGIQFHCWGESIMHTDPPWREQTLSFLLLNPLWEHTKRPKLPKTSSTQLEIHHTYYQAFSPGTADACYRVLRLISFFLAVVNILQSPFIRITSKFSWKTLISMAILYCTSS